MKFCAFCGSEIEDGASYCPQCGAVCQDAAPQYSPQSFEPPYGGVAYSSAPVQQVYAAPNPEKKKKQKQPKQPKPHRKGKVIAIVVLVLVLALAATVGVLYLRWYTSPEQRILRALDSEDYEAVSDIMQEEAFDGTSEAMVKRLTQRIADLKTNYSEETVSYEVAKMELETLRGLDISEIEDDLDEVEKFVEKINTSRTNFATAESFFKTEDYVEAIANYKLVDEDDTNYSLAVEQLDKAAELYRAQVLEKAEEYASQELYSSAIAALQSGLKTIPEDSKLQEQIRLYEKAANNLTRENAMKTAEKYAKDGDYLQAFQSLAESMKTLSNDAELEALYENYCEAYVSQVVKDAEGKVDKKDFSGAVSALNAGLRNLPGNETLSKKLTEVKAKQPVSITELEPILWGEWGTWNDSEAKDTFGNDYSSACNYMKLSGIHNVLYYDTNTTEHYAEYRLYGNYTTLTGAIVPHSDSGQGADDYSYLQIYVDDKLVYTSANISRKTDSIEFSIDVTGADYIKINVVTSNWADAILYDVQLWA